MAAGGDQHFPLLLTQAPAPFGYDDKPFEVGKLHSVRLEAEEEISTTFTVTVTADTTETIDDPAKLLRKPMCVTVRRSGAKGSSLPDRYFHGIIRGIRRVGVANAARDEQSVLSARSRYELTLVPRLWLMELRSDCRIFQDKTTVEILISLFYEAGVKPVKFLAKGDGVKRTYVTQFNETNLQFAQRLMQEAGLYYFFKHSEDDHTLVIADMNHQFESMPRPKHKTAAVEGGRDESLLWEWHASFETVQQQSNLADYDLRAPMAEVKGKKEIRGMLEEQGEGAAYRWPAYTPENGTAELRARYRMEAAESRAIGYTGQTSDPHFCPGLLFSLDEADGDAEYVVRSTKFVAYDETWIPKTPEGTAAVRAKGYWNTAFTCFPKAIQWRDENCIAKPVMTGVFSAIVVGVGGEIDTDKYGRIKVRPLFDARRPLTGPSAQGRFNPGGDIWVRVLHSWAGTLQGAPRGWQHIPRIDTEVGLSFMNGDPDDPVVLGCFYNDSAMPPFSLPEEKTKQGFRSHTSRDTGSQDYNELSFEDEANKEQVYIRAQKNHVVDVMHDRTVTTRRNDTLVSETGDVSIRAAKSITLSVGTSSITILPDTIRLETTGNISLTADANVAIQAVGAVVVDAAGDVEIGTAGAMEINAIGSVEIAGGTVEITSLDGMVVCLAAPV